MDLYLTLATRDDMWQMNRIKKSIKQKMQQRNTKDKRNMAIYFGFPNNILSTYNLSSTRRKEPPCAAHAGLQFLAKNITS